MSASESDSDAEHSFEDGYGIDYSDGDLSSDVEGSHEGGVEVEHLGLEGEYDEGDSDEGLRASGDSDPEGLEDEDADEDEEDHQRDVARLAQLMLGMPGMENSDEDEDEALEASHPMIAGAEDPPHEDDSFDGDLDNASESHLFADDDEDEAPSPHTSDSDDGEGASRQHQGHTMQGRMLSAGVLSGEHTPWELRGQTDDERPIRPASEMLMRAFAGQHPDPDLDDDDEEDTLAARLAYENALLYGTGDVTDPDSEFEENEGINDVDAQEILRRAREDTETPGMDAEELNRIPNYRYDGAEAKDCSICLMGLEEGQEATMLPCTHLFHYTCIMRWLGRSRKCPFCRTEVSNPQHQGGSDLEVNPQN